ERRARQAGRRIAALAHGRGLYQGLELQVEAAALAVARRFEVRQWLRMVGRTSPGAAKRRERIERDDPRRDRRREVLGEEGTERLVRPGLAVARRPVVEQAEPEDMRLGIVDRYGLAQGIARADPDAHLELVVEPA